MTFTLTGLDHSFSSSVMPVYDGVFRFWRCKDADGVDFNVADPDGDVFTVTGTAPLPMLTPMTLYMAFTPFERIAIKGSTDPMVKEFWAMYELSVQLQKDTDPNLSSVQNALEYLAAPASPGPGAGILASRDRIHQILAGVPQ